MNNKKLKKYRGVKKSGDNGTPSENYGLIFEQQESGNYICKKLKGRVFAQWQMDHDQRLGYLQEIIQ